MGSMRCQERQEFSCLRICSGVRVADIFLLLLPHFAFCRMCKLQICRQDSVYCLRCNAFRCHFYYRPLPSSYLRIYVLSTSFYGLKFRRTRHFNFNLHLLSALFRAIPRNVSGKFLGLSYENSYSLASNCNSCYWNQDHDFKRHYLLITK
jgi:hypothetical protein